MFDFYPECYDGSDDRYYIPYDTEMRISTWFSSINKSYDPDCSGCIDCNDVLCGYGDDELIRGIQKFRWSFGDGTVEDETCDSQDDGDFDGYTEHTYTVTGNRNLNVQVTDGDDTCDNSCPPGWPDMIESLTKKIGIVRANLNLSGVSDGDEEDPGGYVQLNDDDDDDDGNCDKNEAGTVSGENDLVSASLSVTGAPGTDGKVRLTISAGTGRIKVWNSATKGTLLIPNDSPPKYYKEWDISSFPSTVHVEGFSISSSLKDTELTLTYKKVLDDQSACTVHSDKVKITVVKVDMDMDYVDDDEETHTGGFVALNDDDDNNNGKADNELTETTVAGENDLVAITLREVEPTYLIGTVTLKTVPVSTKIKVWTDSTKVTEVTLPETYSTPADLPKTLYIEGYQVSGSQRDVTLALEFSVGGNTFDDRVKITVFDVTIDKCSSTWMPKGGSEDNSTTTTATITPSDLNATIKFNLYSVSDEAGYCMNRPATVPGSGEDSDAWKDLQFDDPQTGLTITGTNKDVATTTSAVNSKVVTVNCYDYGAYGKLMAEAQIEGIWYLAEPTGELDQFITIPRDEDTPLNNIADTWTYNTGSATDDADTSLNNTHNGDGLTRYEEYRGVDIDDNGTISSTERLNPNRKDLFVQGSGFDGGFPAFAWGNAFNEAQIDVHEFVGTIGPEDRNIDVLVVEAYNGTAPGNSGNIGRSGPPVAGVRQWYWATQGQSGIGSATQYGSEISYTRDYKVAINNRFDQKPYIDNNTWTAAGVWGGAANGVLDSIVPERVEDTDDDGVLDNNEKDGSTTAPHDDGDSSFDGDYPVTSGGGWDFTKTLTAHDIDNDGSIELPLAATVGGITNDYTRAHVVMRTSNHEMGHSVGKSGHCIDITCAMYGGIPNYNRHGHFCNVCRSVIRIHNN